MAVHTNGCLINVNNDDDVRIRKRRTSLVDRDQEEAEVK